jgi:two-component system, chemotaxis family, protein-glutamate methylesterase/glutaminase
VSDIARPSHDLARTTVGSVKVVAIGGSAGAFAALRTILGALSPPLPYAMLLVLHQLAGKPSALPSLLAAHYPFPISECLDKERVHPNTIYVAPPDYHLLVERGGSIALSRDPPEHFSRPSIDVLFESVAHAYGPGALGLLLSGANRDGARGLLAIHSAGGGTIVQDPRSAEAPRMPQSALDLGVPAQVLTPEDIGRHLLALAREPRT